MHVSHLNFPAPLRYVVSEREGSPCPSLKALSACSGSESGHFRLVKPESCRFGFACCTAAIMHLLFHKQKPSPSPSLSLFLSFFLQCTVPTLGVLFPLPTFTVQLLWRLSMGLCRIQPRWGFAKLICEIIAKCGKRIKIHFKHRIKGPCHCSPIGNTLLLTNRR